MIDLFELTEIIFKDPEKYKEISRGDKQKNYFMLNRRFAIQFPMQANVLQSLKINQSAVVDFWQVFLRRQYKYVPKWMYTKGVKKAAEVKEKRLTVSNELIKEYCKYMKVDPKSVRDALEFFPTQMVAELKEFEIILKQK